MKFCREMPCSPERLLKTAYGIRNFRSVEMDRLFLKTEMYLKSKTTSAISSMPPKNTLGPRSRSSDLLPTSQSQINIQMISHTLTIREVNKTGTKFWNGLSWNLTHFGTNETNNLLLIPLLLFWMSGCQGSSSPDPRPRTLGLYPLHGVRSVTATYESVSLLELFDVARLFLF